MGAGSGLSRFVPITSIKGARSSPDSRHHAAVPYLRGTPYSGYSEDRPGPGSFVIQSTVFWAMD